MESKKIVLKLPPSIMISIAICLFAMTPSVYARTYKCVEPDGAVTYSQRTCPATSSATVIKYGTRAKKVENKECSKARDFAVSNFARARTANGTELIISQHGGISNINSSLLGVINYIATLRANPDITRADVGALVYASCKNNGFGKLNRGDIASGQDKREHSTANRLTAASIYLPSEKYAEERGLTDQQWAANTMGFSHGFACGDYQRRLESIDNIMREGYRVHEGEHLKVVRRHLKARIYNECRQ